MTDRRSGTDRSYYISHEMIEDRMVARPTAECAECGAVDYLGGNPHLPPEIVVKKFAQKGWDITLHGRKSHCPKCAGKSKLNKGKASKVTTKKDPVAKPKNGGASPNPKIMRHLHQLLEEHFDEEQGDYQEGWSDREIAKRTDLSEEFVRRTRQEAYGDLKTPSELSRALSDCLEMQSMVEGLVKEVRTVIHKYR